MQLPDGASKKRTDAVLDKIEQYYLGLPAVYGTQGLSGQNFVFNTRGTNTATMFTPLKHWDERTGQEHHVKTLIAGAFREFARIPEALILAVPFGAFGALSAVWLSGLSNDIYFQIGLVTLIGLSAKNAILIVEFANQRYEHGMSLLGWAMEVARLRFRPIVMTSMAFILGVVPLVIASGAGAASRHSIGTGVMGGMSAATFLAVVFVPLLFALVRKLTLRSAARPGGPSASASPPAQPQGDGEASLRSAESRQAPLIEDAPLRR